MDDVRRTPGYPPQEFRVYPNVRAESLLGHFVMLKVSPNASREGRW